MVQAKIFENTFLAFLFLVFLVIGFFGTFYYVEHESQFKKPNYSTDEILRTRNLTHRLHRVEYQNAHLESEVAELNFRIAALFEDRSFIKAQELSRFVGLMQQEGPGVEVTLKDSSKPLLLGDNPNTGIVHNTDLVQVVNELRAAGASAVAVNNQPIVNLTGISCSGPIIVINGTRVTSPFVVDALGDPEKIKSHLDKPTSFVNELKKYSIEVTVTPKNVVIPAYSQEMATL